jgi:O-antigen ligase
VIGLVTAVLALLYSFPWLRPPEIAGVALPAQRLLAWLGLSLLIARLLVKGPLAAGPAARGFLWRVALYFGFLFLITVRLFAYDQDFLPLYFFMDLGKYAAAFSVAYFCYYALRAGLVSERRFVQNVVLSGGLATLVVYALLLLYYAGFRSTNQMLAPSFGGALGVWPTGGVLPRFAGPTAEPQQLSVALLTPLLLMLSRDQIKRTWPLALLTGSALLLSQSKFAVVSLLLVGLYLFIVFRRWRGRILLAGMLAAPVVGLILIQLPTFSATLESGLAAGAFVERLENFVLLITIIREHPGFGIGPGQFGAFWGRTLYGDWRASPGYTPNMDFLKVFAETGAIGFVLLLILLGYLVRLFFRSYRRIAPEAQSRYLAFALGALGILLNMAIGYELLHAFFWINIAALLFFVDRARESSEPASPDPARADAGWQPVPR